jgi:hypothetical protein
MNAIDKMRSDQAYQAQRGAGRKDSGLSVSGKRSGKRPMTAYNDFVKAHIKTAPGANAQEKMKHVAVLWRKQKGGVKGAGAAAKPKPMLAKITAPAGGEPPAAAADPVAGAGRRRRPPMSGGMINMTPANEIPQGVMRGAGAYGQLSALTGGCASCDKADALNGGSFNPLRAMAGLASTVMPLAGLAAAFL